MSAPSCSTLTFCGHNITLNPTLLSPLPSSRVMALTSTLATVLPTVTLAAHFRDTITLASHMYILACRYTRLAAAGSSSADVSMILQLVLLARSVTNRLDALETHMRSNIATAIPRLQQLAAAGLPPASLHSHSHTHPHQQQQGAAAAAAATLPPAATAGGVTPAAAATAAELLPLRVCAFPAKLQPLDKLRQAASQSRFMSLPAAQAAGMMVFWYGVCLYCPKAVCQVGKRMLAYMCVLARHDDFEQTPCCCCNSV